MQDVPKKHGMLAMFSLLEPRASIHRGGLASHPCLQAGVERSQTEKEEKETRSPKQAEDLKEASRLRSLKPTKELIS